MRELFNKIHKIEGGVLDITRDSQFSGREVGVREDQEKYHLVFNYNGITININCGLGLQSVARITCVLPKSNELNNFEISTKSHLSLLFSSNKNRFKIETQNNILSKMIANNLSYKELQSISKQTKFQPLIMGTTKNKTYTITTEYHLIFDERNETFIPLIQFFKDLIDYLK
jgi:hypothetical protein